MNDLQIFSNDNFGSVRTLEVDGKPYFVANDVAKALGYKRPADAVTAHCKGSVKHRYLTDGGVQELKIIPEGDIYRLVIKSQLPKAEEFERWIFDEVLPTIRRHGMYAKEELLDNPDMFISVLQELKAEREQSKRLEAEKKALEVKNIEMKPKADFFDAVADSKTAISMNDVAKVLAIKGMGRNNLFEFLRDEGILDKFNVPYQRYVDCGWFRVIEQKYMKNGGPQVSTKTLVYQKGVDAIRKRIERCQDESF